MEAVPRFSFFYMNLDKEFSTDPDGLVDLAEIKRQYFIAWNNDGYDGPRLAGSSAAPTFTVLGPRTIFGPNSRPVNVGDFVRGKTTDGTPYVTYGGVKFHCRDGEAPVLARGNPSWSPEVWAIMTSVVAAIADGSIID